VYGGLTAGVIVVALLRASLFFWASMVAATRMHNSMVLRVLRAPLAFFHTNPAGRVLNRFSNDQGRVDDMLPLALFDVLQTGFMCLGVFVLVAAAVPFILPVFAILLVIFYYYRCGRLDISMLQRGLCMLHSCTSAPDVCDPAYIRCSSSLLLPFVRC